MRSLKPIESEENQGVLISSDVKAEIDSKISGVQTAVNNLTDDVDDLAAEVNKKSIDKETVKADTVTTERINATSGYVGSLTSQEILADTVTASDSVNTPQLRADEISADDTTTHILHTDEMNVSTKATIEEIESEKIKATEVTSDLLTATDTSTDTIKATSANLGNATINNLGTPTTFEAGEIVTDKQTVNTVTAKKADIELSEEVKARIHTLVTQTQAFNDDLTDANQFVVLGEPNDGSDGNNDPRYIKIPNVTTGWYRLEVRDDQQILFSLIYSNAETTPIVHYSKRHSGDLTHLYYDAHTDTLWVETYASGNIYWASDSRKAEYAPETYTELDLDMTDAKTYSFNTTRKHQWVLMGNHTAEYALSVQGLIEADIIKSNGDLKLAHFYGNDSLELLHFVQGYFAHKDADDVLTGYQQAEVTGYVYHTDERPEPVEEDYAVVVMRDEEENIIAYFDEDLHRVPEPEGEIVRTALTKWPCNYVNGYVGVKDTTTPTSGSIMTSVERIGRGSFSVPDLGAAPYNWPEEEFRNPYKLLWTLYRHEVIPTYKDTTVYVIGDNIFLDSNLQETTEPEGEIIDQSGFQDCNYVNGYVGHIDDDKYGAVVTGVDENGDLVWRLVDDFLSEPYNWPVNELGNPYKIVKTVYRYTYPPSVRDYDNTKCEALEKVRLIDGSTVVLTVDSDYGQDDITLDYSDGEYGTLPFVLGFTFRSKESDYLLNLDNFKGDASVLEEDE